MTWFDTFADDEQQSVEQLQKQGITGKPTQKKEVGLFDGAADSPIRGAGVGFIKVADTLAKPLDFAGDAVSYAVDYAKGDDLPSFNDYRANAVKQRDDLVSKSIEALEDRENTVSHFLNQVTNLSACSAQKPSGSLIERSYISNIVH